MGPSAAAIGAGYAARNGAESERRQEAIYLYALDRRYRQLWGLT